MSDEFANALKDDKFNSMLLELLDLSEDIYTLSTLSIYDKFKGAEGKH